MISSRSNSRLKAIRRLRRSKGPQALLEGPKLLAEALDCGTAIELVLATTAFLAGSPLAARLERAAIPVLEVTDEVIASLADADGPQGVLSVAHLPRGGAEVLRATRAGGIYLYLDHLQDPGNLGAIARVAEACGAEGLALSPGCVHPNHPRALRASAGSLLRLPVALDVEVADIVEALLPVAPRWLALVPRQGTDLYESSLEGPLVLALGAEGSGLSREVLEQTALGLTIPVAEPVESLNVAVAAAVVLFELARRRRTLPEVDRRAPR